MNEVRVDSLKYGEGHLPICFPPTFLPHRVPFAMPVGNVNEKAFPSAHGRRIWLEPKTHVRLTSISTLAVDESISSNPHIVPPVEGDPKPVSFFGLFRSVFVSFRDLFAVFSPYTLSSGFPLAQSSSSMAFPLLLR